MIGRLQLVRADLFVDLATVSLLLQLFHLFLLFCPSLRVVGPNAHENCGTAEAENITLPQDLPCFENRLRLLRAPSSILLIKTLAYPTIPDHKAGSLQNLFQLLGLKLAARSERCLLAQVNLQVFALIDAVIFGLLDDQKSAHVLLILAAVEGRDGVHAGPAVFRDVVGPSDLEFAHAQVLVSRILLLLLEAIRRRVVAVLLMDALLVKSKFLEVEYAALRPQSLHLGIHRNIHKKVIAGSTLLALFKLM